MKKFFGEFKKFITRGNVVDMSVGVIVGGAFTGIVNGLSNFILKPIINWLLSIVLGSEGLTGAVSFLSKAYTTDSAGNKTVDLANSIFIDWGAFISAIINFFLIAIVLFIIVRMINRVREGNKKLRDDIKKAKLSKEDKKELKKRGIKRRNKVAVKEYLEEKANALAVAEEQAKKEAEEKAKAERLANPTTEDLLKQILAVLENKGEENGN